MRIITKSDTSRRRIAAVGMYDGVHAGHKFLIDYLRLEAGSRRLTPAVITFSQHPLSVVRPLEAPGLLTSLEERLRLLGAAGAEDIIILTFNDKLRYKSAREFLSMLHKSYGIDTLVLGFNNRFGHDRPQTLEEYRKIGDEIGVEVIPAPEYRGAGAPVSSSVIRKHLQSGQPEKAAEALGHPYAIRGMVVKGQRLGRTIAYITTPDGIRRAAMVNIGFRPTVAEPDGRGEISVEAHIFDYNGYIYDEEILVEFMKYLRPESRFASTEKLREQLERDAAKARKILS